MHRPASDTPARDPADSPLDRLLDFLDRRRVWVFFAVGLAYLAGYNGLHRIGDDSSFYLAIGQNLAAGEGYSYRGEPDSLAMPFLPYLLGLCLKASPTYGVSIALGALLAAGLATLVMVYQLFLLYVPRRTAVLAFFLFASNNRVYEVHYRLLTDAPYLLGVAATFLGYALLTRASREVGGESVARGGWHDALAWLLFLLGLAVATTSRIVMLALVMAVGAACVWRCFRNPRQFKHYLIAAGGQAVLVAFYMLDPRKSGPGSTQTRAYESGLLQRVTGLGNTLHRAVTEFVPALFDPTLVEGAFGFDPALPVAVCLSLLVLVMGVIGCWRRPLWLVFLLANLGMFLVFGAAPRYFIPIAFIVYLGGAIMVVRLAHGGDRHTRLAMYAGLGLVLITVLPNFIMSMGILIEQRSPDFYQTYEDGKYAYLPQSVEALDQQLPEGAVILSHKARVLTCYSRYNVVASEEVVKRMGGVPGLARLHEKGELFALLPAGAEMDVLLSRPGVTVGPEVATIIHWDRDEPPLSLHRITYNAEEGAAGQ